MPQPIPLPLARWLADDRPDSTLVAWENEQYVTLGDMRAGVAALASRLAEYEQSRWALCFDDSYHFTTALLALLHSGKTPVIPGHCRASLLREQADLFDGLITDQEIALPCPVLDIRHPDRTPVSPPAFAPIAADACVVLFTSGSTGQARPVIKPIACLDREIAWLASLWGPRLQNKRIVSSVSHQHLYGLTFRIMLPMALGLVFARQPVQFQEQFIQWCAQYPVVFISSPAFLKRLDLTLPAVNCEFVISAGGFLPWADSVQVKNWLGVYPDEIYGSTETGVLARRHRAADDVFWRPFPGVIFSEEEHQVYRVFSELVSESDGFLLDDYLQFSAADQFALAGRRDRIVKIEEKRISLTELERHIGKMNGIADACVVTLIRNSRTYIGAILVLNNTGKANLAAGSMAALTRKWRNELQQWLEPVAIPRYWRVVEEMPVNTQSKRAYDQLQELFHAAG